MTEGCKPLPIACKPGVRRDGTSLETPQFRDAQWVRWHYGRARKMGGYRRIVEGVQGPPYAINLYPINNIGWTHMGAYDGIVQIRLNGDTGIGFGLVERTPAVYSSGAENLWQFSTMYNDAAGSDVTQLVAFVGPNLAYIDGDGAGELYVGQINSSDPLTLVSTAPAVSGGAAIIQPYAFLYGSDGDINWSDANSPTVWSGGDSGSDRITDKKIIYGAPTRGATVPTGVFWSLDCLIRATYVGGAAIWSFNIVADNISVMSSRCVAKYDGVFFWPGKDRFFFYDGVVRELQNNFNSDWFFDNINKSQRQKVFCMINQRYGEILWGFPFGSATEASHAIIYNVRSNYWYDTILPSDGRVSGFDGNVFWWPIMGVDDGSLYLHEFGWDKVIQDEVTPIEAYYETSDLTWLTNGLTKEGWIGDDNWTKFLRVEPDWAYQSGNISMVLIKRYYAQSEPQDNGNAVTFEPNSEFKNFKLTGRINNIRFTSNTQGGTFQQGELIFHVGIDDGRGK